MNFAYLTCQPNKAFSILPLASAMCFPHAKRVSKWLFAFEKKTENRTWKKGANHCSYMRENPIQLSIRSRFLMYIFLVLNYDPPGFINVSNVFGVALELQGSPLQERRPWSKARTIFTIGSKRNERIAKWKFYWCAPRCLHHSPSILNSELFVPQHTSI